MVNDKVRYVGSPYQTSLSEAGQTKHLLVLDRSKSWECVEEIPIEVGRFHFRTQTLEVPPPPTVRPSLSRGA